MLAVKKITTSYAISLASIILCSWSPVATISDVGVEDPYISVNANGEAIAVWTATLDPDLVTQSAFYDGVYWYTNETISNAGFNVNPSVKLDSDGNAIAIWEDLDLETSNRSITTASRPTASSWQSPTVISIGASNTFATLAMNASGQAIAGWVNEGNDTFEYVTQTFGSPWSSIQTIGASGGRKGSVQLGIDPAGNCIAVWEEFDNGIINAVHTTSGFESSWSLVEQLSNSIQSTSPSLSVGATGNAVVSWINANSTVVEASVFHFSTGIWDTSPTPLSSNLTYFPVSSAIGSDYFVTLQNLETGFNQSVRYVSGSWESPVDISTDYVYGLPTISNDSNVSYSAWTDLQTGEVKLTEYGTTGSPTSPLVISNSDFNIEPWLDSSPDLSAAVWVSFDENGTVIQATVN